MFWLTELCAIFTQKIPKKFHHHIAMPPVAVAIIHSGEKCFYVKIEDHKLTEGWYDVVHAHNLGKDYKLLFAYVGHLEFDIFIFDEEGCEVNYSWSTTLGIQHVGAPIGWNSETTLCNTNGGKNLNHSKYYLIYYMHSIYIQ